MTDLLASEIAEMTGEQQPEDTGLSDGEFQSAVRNAVDDAEEWLQSDISPDRVRGSRYYKGECDVPGQPGRSSFVMRVVRDSIEQMFPRIMKSFVGATSIVEFTAKSNDEAEQSAAADATAAFDQLFWRENPGWINLENVIRGALKLKTGVFKVFMKDEVTVKQRTFPGGTMEELQLELQQYEGKDYDTEITSETPAIVGTDFFGQPVQGVHVTANVVVKERNEYLCIETVPPEEFIVNRSATSTRPGGFKLVGQHSVRTVSDLVELGVPYETALKHSGESGDSGQTGDYQEQERRERRTTSSDPHDENTFTDPSSRNVDYYELYMTIDRDGDGIAELRRIIGIGNGPAEIVDDMIVDSHPYFDTPAIPIEHNVIGWSIADNTFDLQDVETQLTRFTLDNGALTGNPPRYGLEGAYDDQAATDNQFNSIIDVKSIGAVQTVPFPFVGDKLLAVRESFNETKAERTGISRESMGLDAQNLQASSEIGVLAVLGAGMTQPDMITGTIANRAIAPMALEVCRLLKEGGKPIKIKSDGIYREVDPSQWPDDMAVEVRVGLGTGTREEELAALHQTAARQEKILTTIGPDNGIVTPEQYAYTLHQITKLSGLPQSTAFYNSPDSVAEYMQRKAQEAAMKPQEPPPEVQKAMMDAKTDIDKTKIQTAGDIQEAEIKAASQAEIAEKDRIAESARKVLAMEEEVRLTERAQDMGVSTSADLRGS